MIKTNVSPDLAVERSFDNGKGHLWSLIFAFFNVYSIFVKTLLLSTVFIFLLALTNTTHAQAVSEGYQSSSAIREGAVVSLDSTNPDQVELANSNNSEYLNGVVISVENSLLALRNENSNIQVARSGEAIAYVSDQRGDISTGDFITVSNINGVAAKTDENYRGRILGVAKEDFSQSSNADEVEINGKTYRIGSINIDLAIFEAVGEDTENSRSLIISFAEQVGGKPVSLVRAIVSFVIFLAAFAVSAMLLFTSIKSMFVSIGRNPLSAPSIFTGVVHVNVVAIITLAIGTIAAYGIIAV